MLSKTGKIRNDIKYSRNPWIPYKQLYYKPLKKTFIPSDNLEKQQNLYRLWILFPSIGLKIINEIFAMQDFNIMKTIDALIYLEMIQQFQKCDHNCRKSEIRSRRAIRCVPLIDLNDHFNDEVGMNGHVRENHFDITVDNFKRNVIINFDFKFIPIRPLSSYLKSTLRYLPENALNNLPLIEDNIIHQEPDNDKQFEIILIDDEEVNDIPNIFHANLINESGENHSKTIKKHESIKMKLFKEKNGLYGTKIL